MIRALLCRLGIHRWNYTPAVYQDSMCEMLAIPTLPAERQCECCGKHQIEDRHCLGLNPPSYTSRWW